MRLKRPAQPLVFQFQRAGSLCAAVACLYQAWPKLEASLCLYRGAYYLKAAAALRQRQSVRRLAAPFGKPLGACPVFYAYCEEHGRCLSTNAVEELFPFGEQLHHVTVMTVEPGFGGQKLQEWPLKKVRTLKAHFPNLLIEVDGGINLENAHIVREAGADVLIAGTAVFTAKDPEQAIQQLRGEPV